MALMNYREANQVLWRGSRPAHNGTQLIKRMSRANGVNVMYAVPAGSTLYLVEAHLCITVVATGIALLYVSDVPPAMFRHLCGLNVILDNPVLDSHFTCWPPMELGPAYEIRVSSSAVGLTAEGAIFGWVE